MDGFGALAVAGDTRGSEAQATTLRLPQAAPIPHITQSHTVPRDGSLAPIAAGQPPGAGGVVVGHTGSCPSSPRRTAKPARLARSQCNPATTVANVRIRVATKDRNCKIEKSTGNFVRHTGYWGTSVEGCRSVGRGGRYNSGPDWGGGQKRSRFTAYRRVQGGEGGGRGGSNSRW